MIQVYSKSRPVKVTNRPDITREFMGYIIYSEQSKRIWSMTSKIWRITKEDALQDAEDLKHDQRLDFINS